MEDLVESGVLTDTEEDLSSGTGLWENSRLKAFPTLEARLTVRVSSFLTAKTIELFGVSTILGNGTADNLSLSGAYLLRGR